MRKMKLEENPGKTQAAMQVWLCVAKRGKPPEKGKSVFISAVGTRCECAWAGALENSAGGF